ncbi:SRPBCC family protein [Nocardioides caldifontis]|uniref:SRPBCC family protein n=1 Tax=Nocardioides caldifontis TaxID=2588938 RepID=UPI0011DF16FF|nr:SRPBCC family protein [Nocardioides caldifontis]
MARSYEETVEVAAPPEVVWSVLVDVEGWPRWTASMTSVELVTPGPLRLGSVAKVKQPKLPPSTFTVDGFEEGRSFSWSAASPGISSTGDHRIEPTATGSRVTVVLHQSGAMAGFVGLAYAKLIRRYVRMEAEGLKREAEARG